MLELYTDATPNGLKVSIALEELRLAYQVHRVFLGGDQLKPEFTALNPNNKIPVLVDGELVLTESGAILVYLAEKTGRLLPTDRAARAKTIELLMFQMSSVGPMFGQLLVFAGAWTNEFPKVTQRYVKEATRILTVLNARLAGSPYFAGEDFTIADIAMIPWIGMCVKHPVGQALPFHENRNLVDWFGRVTSRPAVQKGLSVPPPFPPEQQYAGFVKATIGLGDLYEQH
jgi:GSH-dependent disulfide-bond oxidoreductase